MDVSTSASTAIWNLVFNFLRSNWSDILLIIVGAFALLTYILQERKRVIEAASLVLQQIDELQERIKEIQSYIVNGQLNETAFYESQILFSENHWEHYRHYFVRKMDAKSYRTLNSLYGCASEIQDQQQLMKNLQKNFFFVTQQVLSNLETNYIISCLNSSVRFPVDINQIASGLSDTMPQGLTQEQKTAMENLLRQVSSSNTNADFSPFWNNYRKKQSELTAVINQKGLTSYTPLQIRISLEKALNQYSLLEITGSEGYQMLKRISKRRF